MNQTEPRTPSAEAIAVWVDDPAHCRHAAMRWLDGSFAIPSGGAVTEPVVIPLLGVEVILRVDGTYEFNDTTGG